MGQSTWKGNGGIGGKIYDDAGVLVVLFADLSEEQAAPLDVIARGHEHRQVGAEPSGFLSRKPSGQVHQR